jgi:hypothetical protein
MEQPVRPRLLGIRERRSARPARRQRVFVTFTDANGVLRGDTSVAARTQ